LERILFSPSLSLSVYGYCSVLLRCRFWDYAKEADMIVCIQCVFLCDCATLREAVI